MKTRHTKLHLEELGPRILPSASPLDLQGILSPTAFGTPTESATFGALVQHGHHALHGTGAGGYARLFDVPDVGAHYKLEGVGFFSGIGTANITGDLHGVGFILNGHATGTLKFTNGRGSVTLELTGPDQMGFAPLPQTFHYKVSGGTGAYQHLHDEGTLQLQLTGSIAIPRSPGHGAFTLQI